MISSSSLIKFFLIASSATVVALVYVYQEKIVRSSSPSLARNDSSKLEKQSKLLGIQVYQGFSSLSMKVQSESVPCSCPKGATVLKNFVRKDQFDDIARRRAEEYRKHLIREKPPPNEVLLAPANSPLQYPIHGFTAQPLQKSLIPGLSVHAAEKQNFQVTLGVNSGVLTVEGIGEKDTVTGQGESVLSITASSLQSLNDLLGRVSYRSTVYKIEFGDLVNFTFEQYKAIFPIQIRQLTVPVLYDLGQDIGSQVTITTKTFLRYNQLNRLISSIRNFYKEIKIIIADDSFNAQKVNGTNIEQYFMPPAQGWFAGRNLAISQVTTKYFLWVDDDFEFTDRTKIEKVVEIMESMPELDVVGGSVGSNVFSFKIRYEEGDEEGGCLSKVSGTYQPIPGFPKCYLTSGVVNFFLARTDAVRRVGFDPQLKRVAHSEFFMDGLGKLLVASCPEFSIAHQHKGKDISAEYYKYRQPPKSERDYKLLLHFFKNRLKCVKY